MKYLRIKKNSDFQKLFRRGKKVFSPYLSLLYFPSDNLSMGISISKEYSKKAVKRNRLKRLVRAAFNETCDTLIKPYSIIVIPKVAEEYDLESLKKGFLICFKKVNACVSGEKKKN